MIDPPAPAPPPDDVSILTIAQATAATFSDLFIRQTFLCFIRAGTKRVVCPVAGEIIAAPGDLLIFPPNSTVTLENRPVLNKNYRADGVCYAEELIDTVFTDRRPQAGPVGFQILRADPHRPEAVLELIQETLGRTDLPPPIRRHRLLEPLIWLRHHGVRLPVGNDDQPLGKLRGLLETDLSHPWRISDAASHFAMSVATLRRWLTRSGHGFAKILLNTRLETGLALLQTTDQPISQIALACGFKTPSHFSDAFKKRFGIRPNAIRSASKN